ncbi:MAG: protein kinase domain-containing protein [Polyangia bacterium]
MSETRDVGQSRTLTASSAHLTTGGDPAIDELPVIDINHYELLGEVARGGIGRIIKARDKRLKREVALKQLRDDRSGDDRSGDGRFVREAMLTARLQHPSIIPVHEFGRFASGEPFFAMKLVNGQSLRDAIRERPTLEQRLELLPNVLAVANAIAYAHSQRVIHRDLKPSNVLLGAFGETVVIDWGLAKDLNVEELTDLSTQFASPTGSADSTKTGAILGTPVYMPPEQALGQAVDERADVYALGALLYHVVAGARPFEGATAAEVVHKVVNTSPVLLATLVQGVPADLATIVGRAMARQPAQRYPDARAFADDLRRFQLGQIPSVRAHETEYDAALEAQLDAELRSKAIRPARVTSLLAATLIPVFGIVEAVFVKSFFTPMFAVRCISVALILAILAATYRPFGRRWSFELGLGVIFVVGEMLVAVNALESGRLEAGFTASMLLVFLGCSTLLHMPARKVVTLLIAIILSFAVATLAWRVSSLFAIVSQLMIFSTGILIAGLGVRFSFGLQRAEFYARRRLEVANVRLAKLEQQRSD